LLTALNEHINLEAFSSNVYLQMSAWCNHAGYPGVAAFLKMHADEERMHMSKLFQYVLDRGEMPFIGMVKQPEFHYKDITALFKAILEHEKKVTAAINEISYKAFEGKDMVTFNFIQWYVAEQCEEEALFSELNDTLKLLNADNKGIYLFDQNLALRANSEEK
jgi:ferritin